MTTRRATAQDVDTVRALARAFAPSPSRAERVGARIGQVLLCVYIGFAIGLVLLWMLALGVLAWRVIAP